MPRDAADLAAQLAEATEAGFRSRLLARGQAQSMIRREGALPDDAQNFSDYLDRDLLEYGYSLMSTALRILEVYTSTEPRPAQDDPIELDDEDYAEDWEEDNDSGATETTVASDASDEVIDDQIATSRNAFLQASYALEAATRNASPDTPEIAFHRLIAGAASHVAGYAARAFSLVEASRSSDRLAPMELTLADLVMRNLGGIEERTLRVRSSPELRDDALTAALSHADEDGFDNDEEATEQAGASDRVFDPDQDPEALDDLGPITLLLSEHYLSSVSAAMFAIAFGLNALLAASIADLRLGEDACNDIAAPGPWWVFRLTRHMIADLNQTSIRANLPTNPPGDDDTDDATSADGSDDGEPGSADRAGPAPATGTAVGAESLWHRLRRTYVATLMARDRSEIDLWPSQLHVVGRIFASTDDLVVALPTSAGKTRIAELCILRCLAQKRRAVYVTPLRALSAQTERILEAGTLSLPATILLRSGFDHRSAAIKAVADTDADFIDTSEMREWVKNLDPFLAGDPTWPTESSRGAWVEFTRRLGVRGRRRWGQHVLAIEDVEWNGEAPAPGEWLRVSDDGPGTATLWSPGFDRLGTVKVALNEHREGVLHAIHDHDGVLRLRYRGPNDLLAATTGHTK